MGAGDTINGELRFEREKPSGTKLIPYGPVGTSLLDNRGDVENQMYINPSRAWNRPPPGAGNRSFAPGLVFFPGEEVRVQHKSANLEEAADYDADEFEVSIIDLDLNTGEASPKSLTVANTELSSNPTTSTSDWVTIYKVTVPDRHRYYVAGAVNLAAVEAS